MRLRLRTESLFRSTERDRSPHFVVIDIARAGAAIAVLLWHYQHFYMPFPDAPIFPAQRAREPLYQLLWLFVDHGHDAVQLFWLMSGFVLATVYAKSTASTRAFVVNRIARLYPLHLLTLLVVVGLQLLSVAVLGRPQIYAHNDLAHFVLHLFLASNWLDQQLFSFNAPIWSVSIEVVFYALFWMMHRRLFRWGIAGPLAVSLTFAVLTRCVPPSMEQAMECGCLFFGGCLVFAFAAATRFSPGTLLAAALAMALIAAALVMALAGAGAAAHERLIVVPLVFSLLLVMLSAERPAIHARVRPLRRLGDLTYGVYLWHVPVQIGALIVLDRVVRSRDCVASIWFLLAFVIGTVALAAVSFRWIEAPARTAIRRWGERNSSAMVVAPPSCHPGRAP